MGSTGGHFKFPILVGGVPTFGAGGYMPVGNVFFVSSTSTGAANTTSNGSMENPFATLAYAAASALVTADHGDFIFILPGHAETIAAAAGIACAKAGVSIIGIGNGRNRPTFTWSALASSWTIAGANTYLSNIRCTASIAEVVSMFSVTGAGVTFDAVDVFDTSACPAIQFMLTTAATDDLTIRNCVHRQATAAATLQKWISLVGVDAPRIIDNSFNLLAYAATTSHLISMPTASVDVEIARNFLQWRGATITMVISGVTGTTGIVSDNRIICGTSTTIDSIITGDGLYKFNNLVIDVPSTASGLLAPAVGTLT